MARFQLERGPIPLHHQVFRDLKSALDAHEWRPGDRMPTERALDDLEDAVRADIAPIDDHRSTAPYRAHATATIVRRLAQRLLSAP